MQTTTGQKLFCIPAVWLLSVVAYASVSVEKLATPAVSGIPLRAPLAVQQPPSSDFTTATAKSKTIKANSKPAKILMMASWYGNQFQGRLTASGELFDLNKLTAAHKTLPLGTRVKLTAPATGRSVVVRINDRGPWLKGRDFDLSEAAATALGIHDKGVAAVEMALAK